MKIFEFELLEFQFTRTSATTVDITSLSTLVGTCVGNTRVLPTQLRKSLLLISGLMIYISRYLLALLLENRPAVCLDDGPPNFLTSFIAV